VILLDVAKCKRLEVFNRSCWLRLSGAFGFLLALITFLGLLLLPPNLGATEMVRISNEYLRIGIAADNGRLVELTDLVSGHNFASNATNAPALWMLDLAVGSGSRKVKPSEAGAFVCRNVPGAQPALQLSWSNFASNDVRELCVDVIVRLDATEPGSRWKIAVTKPRPCALAKVHFPYLPDLPMQTNEVLAVPVWMGQALLNPRTALAGAKKQGTRREWEYPGILSLQCMAFYRDQGPGLYLACDDTAAFRKSFAVQSDGRGGLGLEIIHTPQNRALNQSRYAPNYGVVVGTFRGDWVSAAERYRAWATRQVWARESRLYRNQTPAWVTNTALWIWNRGRSDSVLGPAEAMQRQLNLPVSVLWHWWHGCAYDIGFPEYLPPREGAAPFQAALTRAHTNDIHAIVYMNQRLWGLTTESWRKEGAERFSVKAADGKFRKETYNTFTHQPCVTMCMGTAFWRNKYAGIAERAIKEFMLDGIYMDQACSSLACYDPAHGHPLGGGTYWIKGFQQMAGDIRKHSRNVRPIALAGEGCGEPWLSQLDLMLSLEISRERYMSPTDGGVTIPFFQAVYHPYAIQFGNYSSLTMPPYDDLWPAQFAPAEPLKLLDQKYSPQFCLEQARAFVWGQQPTIANFQASQLQERPEEIACAMRLAKIRQRGLKYLLHGVFLRPPELHAPAVTNDLSRLSIYAGQQSAVKSFQKLLPQALAGAWRAADGNVAIALASIADKTLDLMLTLDVNYYGLAGRKQVYRLDETGRKALGQLDANGVLSVSLSPRGACLIEFSEQ
jgi:hypothetical protein